MTTTPITKSTSHTAGIAQQPKFTFELVQIFRGLAAMLVIGYHCTGAMRSFFHALPFKDIFSLGLFGVDFFFVLSGFIITYIHLSDLRQQKNVSGFSKKRFFRIYPIYWFVAIITFAYLLIVDKGKLEYTGHILQWSSAADWLFVIKSFILFPQPAISIVDVSWTLSFEILFYLVFGIAILGGWKFARILFFAWIALILANAFGLWNSKDFYLNFLLSPLIIEFLMGCLLAYIFRMQKIELTLPMFIVLAGCLGAGAFLYLKILHHQLGRDGLNYIFIIGGAMLLLWTCATLDRSRKLAGMKLYPLLLLGDASYSIYLTHTLIIKVLFGFSSRLILAHTPQITLLQANLIFCVIALVTTGIGILVHFSIEKPLLNYTNLRFVPERKV